MHPRTTHRYHDVLPRLPPTARPRLAAALGLGGSPLVYQHSALLEPVGRLHLVGDRTGKRRLDQVVWDEIVPSDT